MFNEIQEHVILAPAQGGGFTTHFYRGCEWIGFGFIRHKTPEQEQAELKQALAERRLGILPKANGWKMHIGIDDATPGNLERGWNCIQQLLIEKQIKNGKIVCTSRPEYTPLASTRTDGALYGKQITIYCYAQAKDLHTPEMREFWQTFATDITNALRENNIRCAPLPTSDRAIPGSEYISYRDDTEGHDGPDPFTHIRVAPAQQQRPAYPVIPLAPPLPGNNPIHPQ